MRRAVLKGRLAPRLWSAPISSGSRHVEPLEPLDNYAVAAEEDGGSAVTGQSGETSRDVQEDEKSVD
jgi:hypothetical protein